MPRSALALDPSTLRQLVRCSWWTGSEPVQGALGAPCVTMSVSLAVRLISNAFAVPSRERYSFPNGHLGLWSPTTAYDGFLRKPFTHSNMVGGSRSGVVPFLASSSSFHEGPFTRSTCLPVLPTFRLLFASLSDLAWTLQHGCLRISMATSPQYQTHDLFLSCASCVIARVLALPLLCRRNCMFVLQNNTLDCISVPFLLLLACFTLPPLITWKSTSSRSAVVTLQHPAPESDSHMLCLLFPQPSKPASSTSVGGKGGSSGAVARSGAGAVARRGYVAWLMRPY